MEGGGVRLQMQMGEGWVRVGGGEVWRENLLNMSDDLFNLIIRGESHKVGYSLPVARDIPPPLVGYSSPTLLEYSYPTYSSGCYHLTQWGNSLPSNSVTLLPNWEIHMNSSGSQDTSLLPKWIFPSHIERFPFLPNRKLSSLLARYSHTPRKYSLLPSRIFVSPTHVRYSLQASMGTKCPLGLYLMTILDIFTFILI